MVCRSKGTPGLREGAKAKNGLAIHTTGFHSFSAWRSHPASLLNDCSCFRRIFYHKYHSLIGGEGIPVLYCRKHLQLAQRQLTGSIKTEHVATPNAAQATRSMKQLGSQHAEFCAHIAMVWAAPRLCSLILEFSTCWHVCTGAPLLMELGRRETDTAYLLLYVLVGKQQLWGLKTPLSKTKSPFPTSACCSCRTAGNCVLCISEPAIH